MSDSVKPVPSQSLLNLKPGDCRRIDAIEGQGSIRQRLLDMGLLPRQNICLERIALGGAPIWIELNGSHLALRREEAAMILVGAEA